MRCAGEQPVMASADTKAGQRTMLRRAVELENRRHSPHVDSEDAVETGREDERADRVSPVMFCPHSVLTCRVGGGYVPLTQAAKFAIAGRGAGRIDREVDFDCMHAAIRSSADECVRRIDETQAGDFDIGRESVHIARSMANVTLETLRIPYPDRAVVGCCEEKCVVW